ncbi:MAG: hypothetical protein LUF28_07890, partial [Clostridiales bacterium]|nr:hypothetical protein [Clostridiales bacterium]
MIKCKKLLALLLAVSLALSVSGGPALIVSAAALEESVSAGTVSLEEESDEEESEEDPTEEEESEDSDEGIVSDAEESEATGEDAGEENAPAEEDEDDEGASDDFIIVFGGDEDTPEEDGEDGEDSSDDFVIVFGDDEDNPEEDDADDFVIEFGDDEDTPEEDDADDFVIEFGDDEEGYEGNGSSDDEDLNDGISLQSLLPLEETDVYLVLSDYSEDELAVMPVDTVVTSFLDSDGNSVPISDSATTVWKYIKDDTDGIEVYEKYTIGNNETIDMSTGEDISSYTMELIIGSGNQLDSNNIRYHVTVYVLSSITESVAYELYMQDEDGNRIEIVPDQVQTTTNTQLNMTVEVTIWTVNEHEENTEYYLGITSEADKHPYIKTDVYTFDEFIYYTYGISSSSITDQILNQDMENENAGYLGTYDTTTSVYDTKNMFVLVYTDTLTGSQISYSCYAFVVSASATSYIEGNVYTYDGNEMTDVVCY